MEWKNAVPLAASLGTEHANCVWSLSQERANLACRGLWRINPDEKYIRSFFKHELFRSVVSHQEGLEAELMLWLCAAVNPTFHIQVTAYESTANKYFYLISQLKEKKKSF